MADFARRLLRWYKTSGRHDLPWQGGTDLYRVWVSEIMLQQTQVSTVIPYYQRFMRAFPDVMHLAAADIDEVLHLWTGLGYYARARNLYKAAQMIRDEFDGSFPDTLEDLIALPGVGRSSAGAILSLGLNQAMPVLDGNVKRVLTRYHALAGWPGERTVETQLWHLAERHLPTRNAANYTQAIMDLGATLCTRSRPACPACPLQGDCMAEKLGLQQELPNKRPKKSLPVKQTVFAILENDVGEILLEKRPASGIWGGLWGFPECAPDQDPPTWLDIHRGYTAEVMNEDAVVRHTFSHFHLDIRPVKLKLLAAASRVQDRPDECWYKPDGKRNLGMAAPVKKLMDELFSTTTGEF